MRDQGDTEASDETGGKPRQSGAGARDASKTVAVLLPCLNEEATIGEVTAAFRRALPHASIHVCDNGSDDGTARAAAAAGAQVLAEPRRGKGRAMRRLFREVDADIYLMADGDGTYEAAAAGQLVATLQERRLDMLVAARQRAEAHAWTPLRRLGNLVFTGLARWRCGSVVHDLLSGYRVLSRRFVEQFPARSDGFEVETELTLFAASSRLAWDEVDFPYRARPEGSASKLKAFRDGARILRTLLFSPTLVATQAEGASRPAHEAGSGPAEPDPRAAGRRLGADRALGAAARIGAVTLAATAIFLGFNWLAVRTDPEPAAEALRASFAHPERTLADSSERFNDCLLSLMTLDRHGSLVERTISPRRVYRFTRPQRPCEALGQRLDHGAVDDTDYLTVFYHQYWAGQRVMLRAALPTLGVDGTRRLLAALTFGLLGLGIVAGLAVAAGIAGMRRTAMVHRVRAGASEAGSLRREAERSVPEQPDGPNGVAGVCSGPASLLRRFLPHPQGDRDRRQVLFQSLALAATLGCLALFLDLDDRAGSFTTGASNVLTLAVFLAVPALRIARWMPGAQVVLFSAFGALIAWHELLFGSSVVALVAVLLSLAAAPPPDHAQARSWRRALLARCTAALVGCLSAVFLLRVLVAEVVFREPVLFKFWDQLAHRLHGAPRSSIHPDIDPFYAGRPSIERFLERLENHLGMVGLGSPVLAIALVILAAVTLLAASLTVLYRWWRLDDPWRWAGILAAGWAVPAWYAIFFAHTLAHAPVALRLVALMYAAAAVLAIGAAIFRRQQGAARGLPDGP